MNKRRSLFFSLLAPIIICTFFLLMVATVTLSTIYMQQTKRNSILSNLEILNQTSVSLELLHSHIDKVAVNISQKPYLNKVLEEPMDSIHDEWAGRQKLASLFSSNPDAMIDYELMIIGSNGLAVSSGTGGVTLEASQIMNLPVYQSALASGYVAYDSRSQGLSYSTQNTPVILGCKVLKKSDGTSFGALLISIREHSLKQFYESFVSKGTEITFISDTGKILSGSTPKTVGLKNRPLLDILQQNRRQGIRYSETKTEGIVLSKYLSYYDAYIVSQITPSLLFRNFLPKVQTVGIIIATLTFLMILITWIIHNNLKPLRLLANHMSSATSLPTPLEDIKEGSYETDMITDAYNQMLETLHHYLEELDIAYKKQRKDELDLLQMQINPHFLYNTLDSVKLMVGMEDSTHACAIIDSLIFLLRSTLNKTNTYVSIQEEMQNVQNYITIIEPRYGGFIRAEVTVSPDCLAYQIPNLLLQPLIENAFFHAFQQVKNGSIRIFLSLEEETIFCDIIDNGDGMSSSQLKHLEMHPEEHQSVTRIGIANVRERLGMLYPGTSSFHITSEPGYGTCIHFSFPAVKV